MKQIMSMCHEAAESAEVTEISDGHICDVYRVRRAGEDHILRVRPDVFEKEHLLMDHALMGRLVAEGFPAPCVFPLLSGNTVGVGPDGRCFEVLQYLPHDSTLEDVDYREKAADVAGLLGQYHKISAGHPRRVRKPDYVGRIPISVQHKYFLGHKQRAVRGYLDGMGPALTKVALRLADRLQKLQSVTKLMADGPQVVAHNDFYGNNVLFCDGEVVGLVDFDFCRTASYAVDLIEGLFAVVVWDPLCEDLWGLNPEEGLRWADGADFLQIYRENSQIPTSSRVVLSMLEAKVISLAFAHGVITRADEDVRLLVLRRAEQIARRVRREAGLT